MWLLDKVISDGSTPGTGTQFASAGMVDWVDPAQVLPNINWEDLEIELPDIGEAIGGWVDRQVASLSDWVADTVDGFITQITGSSTLDFFEGDYQSVLGGYYIRPEGELQKKFMDEGVKMGLLVYRPWYQRHIDNIRNWISLAWENFWGGIGQAIQDLFTGGDETTTPTGTQFASAGIVDWVNPAEMLPEITEDMWGWYPSRA